MQKNIEKLFTVLHAKNPPAGLFKKIMLRISREADLAAMKRRFALFALLLASSVAALIPSFKFAETEFSRSGFADFFSLIFSNSREVLAALPSYALALLESLPVLGSAIFLAAIFLFLQSLKYFARDFKTVFYSFNS